MIETNAEGCSGDMACLNVSILNSVEELLNINLSVFPNPVRDKLNIQINGSNELVIHDLVGQEVWRGFISQKDIIDVSGIQCGAYIISTKIDDTIYSKRFIIN